ncbi:LacI family DNA-binding transcriptional regulator [Hymenobacter sp. BRD67]|uniref:LacI family DNA-binding transcriptional regulator n=1 Tax=Hymenobacter sp. BRD67 TaxID=2675877 RepID=UPI001567C4E4|nr:LacI family DNA-binding transcriptional regulator [Hymenobacter sp. BRD67]QKG52440.1 LacI family DNA-binding transcriptional regulator [Hymenobacter sp. BRD67]
MSSAKKKSSPPIPPAVSMADLARELGVSMTTVSRALSDHHSIGAATKERVRQLAQKLNYQPNHLAAALRKGQSRLLGVVVPYIEGKFFPSVIQGIEQAASKAGFSVIVCQSHEEVLLERRNVETLLSAQVAGVLVSLARNTLDYQHFDKVRSRGIPLVFFDRTPAAGPVNAVVLNDHAGAFQATSHLLAQGCRRIAHLTGPPHLTIYQHRRQGYLDALAAYGIAPDEALLLTSDMSTEAGAQATRQLLTLATPIDAVFAAGDSAILGALQVLKAQRIRVPQAVALAGFSNELFTTITEPQLTSVDQRCEAMGAAAVRLFLELAAAPHAPLAPRQVVLEPELFVRESSQRGQGAEGPAKLASI